jgi:hypothetical protein
MTEKEIEDSILQDFELIHKQRGFYFWKQPSTGLYDPTRKRFRKNMNRFIINGVSDIMVCYKGLMGCLEVKNKTGKLRDSQKLFKENIERYGGIYRVVRSINDARAVLDELERLVPAEDQGA